ncbi:D-glycero-alpha-D-manno-heptose-1,7-bisphosphate 7-phosphatase [Arachidicoccus sp.]|uniref:D-glycero-alpha-D-manno-heptose-1,7-bisphosphate 7-phosphatase n=1 Tax=Arachidicoccus sp. TaxID=1872624 RepID=UPI003D1DF279
MIDKTWTLFLDRDGVLNEDNVGGYVLSVEELQLLDGVAEAMRKFSRIFGTIVVVTNQRSVGKGLLTLEELHRMNAQISKWITEEGGRIDKFYYAPDLADNALNRKPNIGMALLAQKDFPNIDFSKSIMVGNNLSDMQFAKNAGIAISVFLTTTVHNIEFPHPLIDQNFERLKDLADSLETK